MNTQFADVLDMTNMISNFVQDGLSPSDAQTLWNSTLWLSAEDYELMSQCEDYIDEYDEEMAFLEESWRICSPPSFWDVFIGQWVWMDGCPHTWDDMNSVYIPMDEESIVRLELELPRQYTECHINDIVGELVPVLTEEECNETLVEGWADEPENTEAFSFLTIHDIRRIKKEGVTITQYEFISFLEKENSRNTNHLLIHRLPSDSQTRGGGMYFEEGTRKFTTPGGTDKFESQPKKPYAEWEAFASPKKKTVTHKSAHTFTVTDCPIVLVKMSPTGQVAYCVVDTRDNQTAYVHGKMVNADIKVGETLNMELTRTHGHKNLWRAVKVFNNESQFNVKCSSGNRNWGFLIGPKGETIRSIAKFATEEGAAPPHIVVNSTSDNDIMTVLIQNMTVKTNISKIKSAMNEQASLFGYTLEYC